MNIIVRPEGEGWGAFYGFKLVGKSKCRSCIVNAILSVTKASDKYESITVLNEDGTIRAILKTGAKNARSSKKDL